MYHDDECDIRQRVFRIVAIQLGVGLDTVRVESRFIDDLGADSLDTLELAMELEEEFCIDVDKLVDAAGSIITVGDAIAMIKNMHHS